MIETQSPKEQIPHILALGGGYGTIFLYKHLRRWIDGGKLRLTVIDRNNYLCYHGLVPEMLAGKIQPGNVLNPLRNIFKKARFGNGEIEKIDLENKEVVFSRRLDGNEFRIQYDHLVLNLGSVENLSLFPGIAEHTMRLKSFADILQVRHHLITMLELADIEHDPVETERLLHFVVAGGNYAGVEVAGELAEFLPKVAKKRFRNIPVEQIRVTIVHATTRILPELGRTFPDLQAYAEKAIQESPHIRIATKARLVAATPEEAILDSGERIATRTIISCTGTKPAPVLDSLPFRRDTLGRVVTDPYCRVEGHESVWAIGDCAAVPRPDGTYCPPLAIWAMTAGKKAAQNIKATFTNRPLKCYRFNGLGDACTIGHWRAAANLGGFPLKGLVGYLAWRVLVVMYVPLVEKRFRVILDWLLAPIFGRDLVNMNIHKPVGVTPVMYEPGQDIVREGEVGQSLFIIRAGEVEVFRKPTAEGPLELLATLGAGDHFGEVAVFQGVRRTATVRAKTRVELLHIRREAALALSESSVEIARTLQAAPGTAKEEA